MPGPRYRKRQPSSVRSRPPWPALPARCVGSFARSAHGCIKLAIDGPVLRLNGHPEHRLPKRCTFLPCVSVARCWPVGDLSAASVGSGFIPIRDVVTASPRGVRTPQGRGAVRLSWAHDDIRGVGRAMCSSRPDPGGKAKARDSASACSAREAAFDGGWPRTCTQSLLWLEGAGKPLSASPVLTTRLVRPEQRRKAVRENTGEFRRPHHSDQSDDLFAGWPVVFETGGCLNWTSIGPPLLTPFA